MFFQLRTLVESAEKRRTHLRQQTTLYKCPYLQTSTPLLLRQLNPFKIPAAANTPITGINIPDISDTNLLNKPSSSLESFVSFVSSLVSFPISFVSSAYTLETWSPITT